MRKYELMNGGMERSTKQTVKKTQNTLTRIQEELSTPGHFKHLHSHHVLTELLKTIPRQEQQVTALQAETVHDDFSFDLVYGEQSPHIDISRDPKSNISKHYFEEKHWQNLKNTVDARKESQNRSDDKFSFSLDNEEKEEWPDFVRDASPSSNISHSQEFTSPFIRPWMKNFNFFPSEFMYGESIANSYSQLPNGSVASSYSPYSQLPFAMGEDLSSELAYNTLLVRGTPMRTNDTKTLYRQSSTDTLLNEDGIEFPPNTSSPTPPQYAVGMINHQPNSEQALDDESGEKRLLEIIAEHAERKGKGQVSLLACQIQLEKEKRAHGLLDKSPDGIVSYRSPLNIPGQRPNGSVKQEKSPSPLLANSLLRSVPSRAIHQEEGCHLFSSIEDNRFR